MSVDPGLKLLGGSKVVTAVHKPSGAWLAIVKLITPDTFISGELLTFKKEIRKFFLDRLGFRDGFRGDATAFGIGLRPCPLDRNADSCQHNNGLFPKHRRELPFSHAPPQAYSVSKNRTSVKPDWNLSPQFRFWIPEHEGTHRILNRNTLEEGFRHLGRNGHFHIPPSR